MPPVENAPASGGGGVVNGPSAHRPGLHSTLALLKGGWLLGQGFQDRLPPQSAHAHPMLWPGFPAEMEVMVLCSDRGDSIDALTVSQLGTRPAHFTAKQRFHRCHIACTRHGRSGHVEKDVMVFPQKDKL